MGGFCLTTAGAGADEEDTYDCGSCCGNVDVVAAGACCCCGAGVDVVVVVVAACTEARKRLANALWRTLRRLRRCGSNEASPPLPAMVNTMMIGVLLDEMNVEVLLSSFWFSKKGRERVPSQEQQIG
jgi:hypothetical protein